MEFLVLRMFLVERELLVGCNFTVSLCVWWSIYNRKTTVCVVCRLLAFSRNCGYYSCGFFFSAHTEVCYLSDRVSVVFLEILHCNTHLMASP